MLRENEKKQRRKFFGMNNRNDNLVLGLSRTEFKYTEIYAISHIGCFAHVMFFTNSMESLDFKGSRRTST
jgi:hypothetical protein